MSGPSALLFDLDGTLVDTAPDLGGAANRIRRDEGLAPLPLDELRPYASQGARGLLRKALGLQTDDARYAELRQRFLDYYREDISLQSQLFAGFEPLLSAFETHGRCWGVVTNKPTDLAEPLMRALGLADRAACLVGGDSAAKPKPAPDPLLMACRQIGREPADCLYVGDDRRDIEAAQSCKMPVIAALWGYHEAEEDPYSWGADGTAASPAQLMAWLEENPDTFAAPV
ncbi:phosphoglycolate phosphatase [Algiphilus sp. W345]|uniref:phosphoglycolate phosphatase n=1 Tax=Banduia mediterranea TaxID=3075609 RepID=A0ABU2WME5_9GAMM|nr:phosphoglycolate phosphatase [Algiphilus sp. W345]MDT0499016.1 phosphoglycolate phosphatase [Algiphilus sp. W345]